MKTKDKLIKLLEENRGKYLSGAEIADQLGCTRGAVWKAINSLREDGCAISAVTNKGYCLETDSDVLSEDGVRKYLGDELNDIPLQVYKVTDSTNTRLRELANKGAEEKTVVIAGEQTAGKGRLGRSFFSPSDTGLYISILLRPVMSANEALKITTAAAVAVAEAIEALSDKKPEIKWVNDVYIDGRKICGILTEAAFSMENGGLEYAVSGIGINVYQPEGGFPDEIKDIAGAVFDRREGDLRNRLAAELIKRFMKYYHELDEHTYMEGYRKRLMWRNEKINIISPKETIPATMIDVDNECRLIARFEDSTEHTISTGEISIRKAQK